MNPCESLGAAIRRALAMALAGGTACTPPVADPPKSSPMASDPASVVVTVTPHEEGLRAVYRLPTASDRLAFVRADELRRTEWRVTTAGVRLEDDVLISASPRTDFALTIPFDTVELDRVYPALHRVAGGAALYGPTLLVEGMPTRIELRPDPGGVALPEEGSERGYAWLGPAGAVAQGDGFRMIVDASISPRLAASLRDETGAALADYRTRLARASVSPTVLASMQSTLPNGYRGDASGSALLSLRFFEPRWNDPDDDDGARLARFVRHEAFHLWNRDSAEHAAPWLHEGGAEYAAVVTSVAAGLISADQGRAELEAHYDGCREALGDRALSAARLSGMEIYRCGVALQWIVDAEARAASAGARDGFAVWRVLLDRAGDGGYTLADLRAVTGSSVAAMLDDTDPGRWARLKPPADGEAKATTPGIEGGP